MKAFSPPTPMVHPGCAAILERRYDLVRPKPAAKATLHVRTIRSCIPHPFCACSCGLHLSGHHDVSSRAKRKVTKHIVLYLPGFDLDPKDIRFLGTPIDLIAFKGLNGSEEIEIVFIEVKTGRSVLSARERAVKKAVEEKKVSWRVFNPDLEIDHQRIPTTSKGSPLGVQS